jgi:hypothetical protein
MEAKVRNFAATVVCVFFAVAAQAQLAPAPPQDSPHALTQEQASGNDQAIAPYVRLARDTYPAARDRYLRGLPSGEHFFTVTRLTDARGHWEQVFIRVTSIAGDTITGAIASDVTLVSGFKAGQIYAFKESQLIDWLISKPDGSEEGNVVGKYLDTVQH